MHFLHEHHRCLCYLLQNMSEAAIFVHAVSNSIPLTQSISPGRSADENKVIHYIINVIQ